MNTVDAIADVVLIERFPGVDDYRRLRSVTGLSPKGEEASRRGLANTLYGISLVRGDEVVGMGRIIGDDGCFYFVVDIAVVPELQGRGLGHRIMAALDAWVRTRVPASAHVSLFADGNAKYLYERYGFVQLTKSVAMAYVVPVAAT